MKPGTSGFIGARLREAREARGLTAISLADIVGVSRQAVSQYESEKQSPRPEVMERIASTLKLPVPYFRTPINIQRGYIFYRSMSSATKAARTRAENRYLWLRIIDSFLRKYVQFPKTNFPHFDLPKDPHRITEEMIEELAVETRRFWNINDGPIKNMVLLLENNGCIIARDELGAETLDAFSDITSDSCIPYIILGSDKGVSVRSRFDAAHEMAHKILHQNIDNSLLTRKTEYNLIEKQAHRFAGAFLLPSGSFANDFYSANLDALSQLKPKWNVAISMMLKRAEDLNFISSEQARFLWMNMSRRGWKTKEPFDDKIEVEQPKLLRNAIELLVSEGVQTREDILLQIPLAPHDIESITSLAPGYLTQTSQDENPKVTILKPKNSKNNSASNKKADIIPFQKKI